MGKIIEEFFSQLARIIQFNKSIHSIDYFFDQFVELVNQLERFPSDLDTIDVFISIRYSSFTLFNLVQLNFSIHFILLISIYFQIE